MPFRLVRNVDVWYRGAWVDVGDVTDEDFDAYLAESHASWHPNDFAHKSFR